MNKEIQKRITDVIETTCDGNKSEFCRRIGREANAVKDIVGGGMYAPSYSMIYDIRASDLGISAKWLICGEGEMLEADEQQKHASSVNIQNIQAVYIANWGELVDLLKK